MATPGIRIRMLRVLLGISREAFCERYGMSLSTLTSIELNRLKASPKQVDRIIKAFSEEKLQVSSTWIMKGKGNEPTRFLEPIPTTSGDHLESWARCFFSHTRHMAITQVKGDGMEPFYSAGDLVGGLWNSAPQMLLGKRCIVLWEGQIHIGTLLCCKNMFSLTPSNIGVYHGHLVFYAHEARVAEIVWHIRKHSHRIPELMALEEKMGVEEPPLSASSMPENDLRADTISSFDDKAAS